MKRAVDRDAIRQALSRHDLFEGLAVEALDEVAALGHIVTLRPGQVLFRKGDPGDFLFCVLEGQIQIGVETATGDVHHMNLLPPGTVFGEIALLDDLPRSADAYAVERTCVFTINRNDFHALLLAEPRLHQPIIRLLCERVRWTSAMVEAKSHIEMELRKLTSAVEHSPNLVLITDIAGRIEYVNRKFTAVTGWQPEEVIGKTTSLFKSGLTPPSTYQDLWRTILDGGEWHGEFCNRRKDGSLYWEKCSIAPVRSPTGLLTHFVALKEDVTETKRLQEELTRLASQDSLTGIANRRHFLERAHTEIIRAGRAKTPLAVLMLDVDHFKKINDEYGHAAGDAALKALADTCRSTLRETDLFGRLGGEEFGILFPGDDLNAATEAAERLRLAIAATKITIGGATIAITASLGLSLLQDGEKSIDAALSRADQALYVAKQAGRNRLEISG
ncbi:diguanylate cyclase/phosphodiesterase (GGDEF & EAL domains) with PAS/PAC sensor(s) [Paramagnetospirillum magnetotacticum MS-1]|uniref:Diguanylate cyclase/phosphodiesterase (GGDEF & EAL domains) with PAS/PAC sensor(S) n=1 Tax=Paramagnetospirillum magnetotacticum MS-1 TaxID=272627 RepID=A0A0C2V532_PARME|nr:diguanylate cyclase [Paramagnetospirillum magnetotacticum]KIM00162.1 diguanylate cyclase/phosphodiesterase (GGDEF & EAL domains) with PAS/PAC sensor(s) [Paramagnetospirillum magnetotacticum MS-1]